ncbi:receptor-like protein EIX1 [Pistacia vera]|uniref:receptor-like protein EIX1 n=1 Tax=Pistacia vera TaxID=55513 RepID=UPI0012638015|nr:receptor-like protein EIX1 [Pistacia vera]
MGKESELLYGNYKHIVLCFKTFSRNETKYGCCFVALFLELLAIATIKVSFCNGSSFVGCIESEREALLRFKHDLIDPNNRLDSWRGDGDCCAWPGVVCGNLTGHVLELNLGNPALKDYASDVEYDAYERSKLSGDGSSPTWKSLQSAVS